MPKTPEDQTDYTEPLDDVDDDDVDEPQLERVSHYREPVEGEPGVPDHDLHDRHFPKVYDERGDAVPLHTVSDRQLLPTDDEPERDHADPCPSCGKAWYFLKSFTDGSVGIHECEDCQISWPIAPAPAPSARRSATRSVRASDRGGSTDRKP